MPSSRRRAPNRYVIGLWVATWLALALLSPPWQAWADDEATPLRSSVTVSLTYDDGTSDQLEAASIMASHGMTGTFYLNSSRLGSAGRLSVDDALRLQTAGNEIGGHTVTHADLPTLSTDEQGRQVCNDRAVLLNDGLHVTNFAYPYGDDSPEVQQIVAGCGYNSARVVGDIVSPGSCSGCPPAEQMPPRNPYAVRTPNSIKPSTSLEQMQNYVLQAEQGGGGWVVIVMHRICDACDPYAVDPGTLDDFLSWLALRATDGTAVRNVAEVIGGNLQPAVAGPPPASRRDGAELLGNPSMERDTNGDGIPDCWQRGGYGDNSWSWSNSADPHGGSAAMQVAINRFVTGDRRIMTPQDLGACAPGTVVGHSYQVSGWYRLSGAGRLVAYYRDPANRWIFLAQGPALPMSTEWRQATWTPPAVPAGSVALSVGLSLRSVGVAAADDFSVQDVDQTPPDVELGAPDDGARLRGTVTFAATASDASGVDHVDFLVDGNKACAALNAPYQCEFDTTTGPDTVVAVTARAVDTAGNLALSASRNYAVSNSVQPDTEAPTVSLSTPDDGATVDQNLTLTADASDDDLVSRVLYYVDGSFAGAARSAPYTFVWDSSTHADGTVRLQAKALDRSGNLGSSAERSVIVHHDELESTPPTTTALCDAAACGTGWYDKAVQVTLAATDDASGVAKVVYTTDGSQPTATNGTLYDSPLTVSSSTTIYFRAWDNAGNAEPVRTLALNVDTVAPTARVAAPVAGDAVTGTIYLKAEVADAGGVARVYFYLDAKLLGSRIVAPYQWKWDSGSVPHGAHTLQITVLDNARNQTKSEPVTVTVY